jgi:hypothetical protein
MQKLVIEDENEGLISLLGERVTLFCMRYIYTGKLIGVNDTCVKLEDCGIVYDTGSLDSKDWDDYQKLPNDYYIQTSSIESFGIVK